MKKRIISLIALFCLAGYWFFVRRHEVDSLTSGHGESIIPEARVSKKLSKGISQKTSITSTKLNSQIKKMGTREKSQATPLTEAEIEALEEYYDQVESDWANEMEALFVGEFGLSESDLETYYKVREEYEVQKMKAFEAYQKKMSKEQGEQYAYQASEDSFYGDVEREFAEKMEDFLGRDRYERYLEVRTLFNQSLRENQNPNNHLIVIEL